MTSRRLRRCRHAGRAVTLALATAGLLPALASAATAIVVAWTLTVSPLKTDLDVTTTFRVTATNMSTSVKIGCIQIDTTSHFAIKDANAHDGWDATFSGTLVTLTAPSPDKALGLLGKVTADIDAAGIDVGTWSWKGAAFPDATCKGGAMLGVQLLTIVVVGPPPTPTPRPSILPTPLPSVGPSPLPSLLPSLRPEPSATPAPTASPSPSASPTTTAASPPSASASTGASGSADEPEQSDGPFTIPAGGTGGLGGGIGTPDADLSATLTIAAPALLLSIPGLILVLAFAAQVAGGMVWIPVIRRGLGQRDRRRPRRFIRRA